MSEADALDHFERALEQSIGEGASTEDIEAALATVETRLEELRVVRGEA